MQGGKVHQDIYYNFTSIDETTRYSHGGKYFYRFQVKLT